MHYESAAMECYFEDLYFFVKDLTKDKFKEKFGVVCNDKKFMDLRGKYDQCLVLFDRRDRLDIVDNTICKMCVQMGKDIDNLRLPSVQDIDELSAMLEEFDQLDTYQNWHECITDFIELFRQTERRIADKRAAFKFVLEACNYDIETLQAALDKAEYDCDVAVSALKERECFTIDERNWRNDSIQSIYNASNVEVMHEALELIKAVK